AINLIFTFAIPGISIGGHLGGLIGGAAVGSVMLKKPPDRRSVAEGVAIAALVAAVSVAGAVWATHRARPPVRGAQVHRPADDMGSVDSENRRSGSSEAMRVSGRLAARVR